MSFFPHHHTGSTNKAKRSSIRYYNTTSTIDRKATYTQYNINIIRKRKSVRKAYSGLVEKKKRKNMKNRLLTFERNRCIVVNEKYNMHIQYTNVSR